MLFHFVPTVATHRDQLGLNSDGFGAGGVRAERARQALLKNELRAGLSQLPSPSMEYAIEAPELPVEDGGDGATIPVV